MYLRLDPKEIVATANLLHQRIKERFPTRGLTKVCGDVVKIASEAEKVSASIRRPNWTFRIAVTFAVLVLFGGTSYGLCQAPVREDLGGISDYIQGIQAFAQILVYIVASIFFLVSLEIRLKRAQVLRALHELRALAHIVDMHQLTKDPETVRTEDKTDSSPERTLTVFELSRYLDYCSEMLSLLSKVAALYVQDFHDALSVDAAGDLEDLTTGLSRKIWQKISLLRDDVRNAS